MLQTFALYNATSYPDEALRLRQAKRLPMPSEAIFNDAQGYTNWQPAPKCAPCSASCCTTTPAPCSTASRSALLTASADLAIVRLGREWRTSS